LQQVSEVLAGLAAGLAARFCATLSRPEFAAAARKHDLLPAHVLREIMRPGDAVATGAAVRRNGSGGGDRNGETHAAAAAAPAAGRAAGAG
jgi:hypothetical protein